MNLAHTLAGFTLGEGDLLRRALEKNDTKKIEQYREQFTKGCKYPEEADELFHWIGANASYLFNKSHALVYSLVGYWCAYYKANYPKEFLVANLNHPKKTDTIEYISKLIYEAREMGIQVQLPKMGKCPQKTSIIDEEVVYGLTGIKGISDKSAQVLSTTEGNDFDTFVANATAVKSEHFINGKKSLRSVINKGHILALTKIGFFGDPAEIIYTFNYAYKAEEPTDLSFEDSVNDAVGFEWYSELLKYHEKLDAMYRNEKQYMLIQITYKKSGEKNGREWTMIKGKTPNGDITAFLGGNQLVSKGDVIIAKYRKGNKDSINIDAFKLCD